MKPTVTIHVGEALAAISDEKPWIVIQGDVREVLASAPGGTFSACLSDVPYGLGSHEPTVEELIAYLQGAELDTGGDFMGHDWSVPSVSTWREIERVLKPGAYAMSFAGSRTHDLITLGMRAGRFEIHDAVMWLQAEGMAKPARTTDKFIDEHLGAEREVIGLHPNPAGNKPGGSATNITAPASEEAKLWDGYGHALAPSWEPIILGRKELDGTIAGNVIEHGAGALNIVGCRARRGADDRFEYHRGTAYEKKTRNAYGTFAENSAYQPHGAGRWPKNVVFSHHPECAPKGTRKVKTGVAVRSRSGGKNFGGNTPKPVMADSTYASADGTEEAPVFDCHPSCPVRMLDAQSGERPSGVAVTRNGGGNKNFRNIGGKPRDHVPVARPDSGYADSGAASRFFPVFQAGDADRFLFEPKVSTSERELGCEGVPKAEPGGPHNDHPCLKPIELTTWLATLLRPPHPDAILLVPYCGSGSEIIGALRAGWRRVIGIERDARAVAICQARVTRWEEARRARPDFTPAQVVASAPKVDPRQVSLFGGCTP